MAQHDSPSLLRRELAVRLRDLRRRSGLTIRQASEESLISDSTIGRIETRRGTVNRRDVRDLCKLYGASDHERAQLESLTGKSREREWETDFDVSYQEFIGYEQAASAISEFNPAVVPGLIQTEAYARGTIRAYDMYPPEEVAEEQVRARMRR
jgi:transcriptional regulator with XRE-family HTH domain